MFDNIAQYKETNPKPRAKRNKSEVRQIETSFGTKPWQDKKEMPSTVRASKSNYNVWTDNKNAAHKRHASNG